MGGFLYSSRIVIVSIKAFAVSVLLLAGFAVAQNEKVGELLLEGGNPCCRMPCRNRGVCTPLSSKLYECFCPAGYYGKTCEKSSFSRWLANSLNLDQSTKQKLAHTGKLFWGLINNVPLLHNAVLRYLYLTGTDLGASPDQILHYRHDYDFLGGDRNASYFDRGLPPVPLECPTPLGVKGPTTLPDIKLVFDRLFKRTRFKPCPLRTNLMFATFAQYLSYHFFKIDFPKVSLPGKSDYSKLSDIDEVARKGLRSGQKGKLKARIINGEEYPPCLEDVAGVFSQYPQVTDKRAFPQWALSHQMLSITPFVFALATIWLREHNRICDVIGKAHPDWNDERIYQTARWIVLGELLTITGGEYFQHLAQYRLKLGYKPHLVHNEAISSSSQMQHEFSLAFQWHEMMPESLCIQDKAYNLSDLVYGNNRIVFQHGLDAIIDFMCRTPAGQITHENCGEAFGDVMRRMLEEGRRSRLHSFNEYRRFLGLKPYKTFQELTGEEKVSKLLKGLYGDVDAVEFVVGCFLEKHVGSVIPPTMMMVTGPVALRRILNNPIGSAALWRPSTFGGKVGFDIVQKATLKKLICLNLRGNCKNNVWVSFKTPLNVLYPPR